MLDLYGGTFDPLSIDITGGSSGGDGTVIGNLDVSGGDIDVGNGGPGLLSIDEATPKPAAKSCSTSPATARAGSTGAR